MKPLAIAAAVLVLLLAIYCKLDPFNLSPIADYPHFQTFKVNMPPWSQIPKPRDAHNLLRNSRIKFSDQVQGPESLAFDPLGRGPYTGVADGRVVVWYGHSWSDFAYSSPNRSEICGWKPSTASYWESEHVCGRPLGLRFDSRSGELYIADAYFGLMKVGPEGGLATTLATEAEGVKFKFTNDLDVDDDETVYFTDRSSIHERRNFVLLMYSAVANGRVLRYDPKTKQTNVLM
uniref:Strictosidine synthase conserved region domain-containing protein n=1 Tax=Kalanchoe fedtschenkoi TaxID=63787 RepID=A0A7N0RII3_KALFE